MNGTIKNDLIILKKERNAKNAFLKILNGTEKNGTDINLNERLKSGTRSYSQERVLSREHCKSGMCSKSSRND